MIVQSFPDSSLGKWQISSNTGRFPRWRRDGRELYYRDGDQRLLAVSVTDDGTFTVGKSTVLSELPVAPLNVGSSFPYDVTANGQRFIVASATPAGSLRNPLTSRSTGRLR